MGFQRSRDGWDHSSAGEEMEACDPVLTRVHAGSNNCERSCVLKQHGWAVSQKQRFHQARENAFNNKK